MLGVYAGRRPRTTPKSRGAHDGRELATSGDAFVHRAPDDEKLSLELPDWAHNVAAREARHDEETFKPK